MKKKILCMSLALALFIGQISAVDFFWGVSAGLGKAVFRGEDAKNVENIVENYISIFQKEMLLSPTLQADLLLEISPHFAVETGLTYRLYMAGWAKNAGWLETVGWLENTEWLENAGKNHFISIMYPSFIIPVMARGTYDFGMFSVYGSIGPKFILPFLSTFADLDYYQDTKSGITTESNSFLMDLGFAIGFEIKSGKFYVGLRGNYDLNLISPLKTLNGRDAEWYHDNLNLSITFRDAMK